MSNPVESIQSESKFFFFPPKLVYRVTKKRTIGVTITAIYSIFLTNKGMQTVYMENTVWKPQLCRRLLKAAAYRNPPPGNSDDWPPVSTEHWSICKLYKAKGHDFKSVQCSKTQGNFSCFSLCTPQRPVATVLYHWHLQQVLQRRWKGGPGENPQGFPDVSSEGHQAESGRLEVIRSLSRQPECFHLIACLSYFTLVAVS